MSKTADTLTVQIPSSRGRQLTSIDPAPTQEYLSFLFLALIRIVQVQEVTSLADYDFNKVYLAVLQWIVYSLYKY